MVILFFSTTNRVLFYTLIFFYSISSFLIGCTSKSNSQTNSELILISIDGFNPSYLEWYETENLDRFIDKGVVADYMIPVFPTKTFPNHYSIATGLFVENTGIIANNMYDPEFDEFYSLSDRNSVQDAKWYAGEPIWVTAEKYGIPTAPLFWPGSEAPIGGEYPTRWQPYDHDLPYKARVDSVITWLTLDDSTAPKFITLYFSKVDTYGHRYGPKSDQIAAAVKEIDFYIGYLINELKGVNKWGEVNIIIVSDHGMAEVSNEKVILLDEIVNLDDVNIIDWAPLTTLYPKEGLKDDIYLALKKAENNYTVFKKDEIPNHFRYRNNLRVPEIVLIAETGYSITSTNQIKSRPISGGDHGYDYRSPEMRSLFIAKGPSFKQSLRIQPFQNVHIYELMTNLLNIDPAPNDGSIDSLMHILHKH